MINKACKRLSRETLALSSVVVEQAGFSTLRASSLFFFFFLFFFGRKGGGGGGGSRKRRKSLKSLLRISQDRVSDIKNESMPVL